LIVRTIKAQLQADELQGPGYGWLHLEPLSLQANCPVTFTIERNQDGRFLAASGQWEPSATWHSPLSTDSHGDRVACGLGPNVIDALLANPQMQYRMEVRAGDQAFQAVLRLAAGLYPSGARAAAPEPEPAPAPPPEPEIIEATPEPTPIPVAAPPKRSKAPLLLGLLVLALVGLAAWWWLLGRDEPEPQPAIAETVTEPTEPTEPIEPAEPTEPTEPSAPAEPQISGVALPCDVAAMGEIQDTLAYLQTCVQSNPSSEQILAVIEAGKAADQCDLIQRLYAHAAQAGHASVTLAYAREFDPETFSAGCFQSADAETAIYWYDLYLRQQPNDPEALDRRNALKESP
jgi:hypothetical protein